MKQCEKNLWWSTENMGAYGTEREWKRDREQNMKCTCNVTLRRVRATIVTVENNKYYIFGVCACSLSYPVGNAHAPYCHLWPVGLYNIFQQYFMNGTIFGEGGVIEQKMHVSIFSVTFVWNISHYKNNWARYDQKCTSYSCQILMALVSSREIFEKYSNTKFHENPSSGSWLVPCGRTDRHDEANNRFSQFANAPNTVAYLRQPVTFPEFKVLVNATLIC